MTKLTSEILKCALVTAGVYNVDFLTSLSLVGALNNIYSSCYSMIASSSSSYRLIEAELEIEEDGWFDLPIDCSLVKEVRRNGMLIQRCPPKERLQGTYRIANSRIKIYDPQCEKIEVVYVPVPQTITMPAPSKKLNIEYGTVSEWGLMTEEGVYLRHMTLGDCYYDFGTGQLTNTTFRNARNSYAGYNLEWNADEIRLSNGDDYSADFQIVGNPFVSVVCDDPYVMVSYEDGNIVVAQLGRWQTIWNIKAITGHATRGKVVAMRTNDETLYGCIYDDTDSSNYYLSSFVPDTLLNYPNNTLFEYMEAELAVRAASINGQMDIGWIKDLRDDAKAKFIAELRQDSALPIRMANTRR